MHHQQDRFRAFLPYPLHSLEKTSGPLEGLRLAVKDLFDVKGYPTGFGQPSFLARSGLKPVTAPLVEKHLSKGCSFVGKTHLVEMAFALTGRNIHFGTPINPKHPDRLPGGSSSGSAAAVGSHLADIGLATDTLGSIRVPASYCGLCGLRPTHGSLSLEGAEPLSPSLDTAGWLTRDLDTLERLSNIVLENPKEETPDPMGDLCIAHDLLNLAGPACRKAFDQRLRPIKSWPEQSLMGPKSSDWPAILRVIQGFEAWSAHHEFIHRCSPSLGPGILERFEHASGIDRECFEAAQDQRRIIQKEVLASLEDSKILMFPSAPGPAPSIHVSDAELETHRSDLLRLMAPSSLLGIPELTIPLLEVDGASVGLSLIGPPGSETRLLAAAKALTQNLQASSENNGS